MIDAARRLRRFGWLIALAIVVSQGLAPGGMLRSAQASTLPLIGQLVPICHTDGGSSAPAQHDCQQCPDCAAAHLQPVTLPSPLSLPVSTGPVTPAAWTHPPQHAPPSALAAPHARGPPASA